MHPAPRYALIALGLTLTACGDHDHAAGVDPEHAQPYHRHHPVDAETGLIMTDSLGFPGNHPTDPATGELDPQPIRDWTYVDQRGEAFGSDDLRGKVYVADFFFTSCPTICPKVKSQMLRLLAEFGDHPDFALVSFTIDPKRDTPERMLDYARKLGVADDAPWHYIHGDKFEIYDLDQDYLSIAEENAAAPGGFDHSGYIVLVDRAGRVRAYASGLKEEEVTHLMEDIRMLL